MFSLEVSTGFNRLLAHLCLTNWIVQHAQSHRDCFEDFPWPQLWSASVCVRVCVWIVHGNELKPYNPSPLNTLGLNLLHCHVCMWLPPRNPPLPASILLDSIISELMRVGSQESSFVLTYIPKPGLTNTGTAAWKPAHVHSYAEGQLCLAFTGNSGLRRRGGVWRNREEKRFHRAWEWAQRKTQLRLQMWKHPVHTHTHIYKDTQIGKGGGNEGRKTAHGAPLGVSWLVGS